MLHPRQAFTDRPAPGASVPRRRMALPDQASTAGLHLLGEVLARLNGIERPVVQIISASPRDGIGRVAQDLAAAAACRFGRTLLVSTSDVAAPDDPGARGLTWLMNGFSGGEPNGLAPDALVPGLYHTRLRADDPGILDLPVEAWLAGPQAFRMIVVESPAIAADPRALAVASRCHGAGRPASCRTDRARDGWRGGAWRNADRDARAVQPCRPRPPLRGSRHRERRVPGRRGLPRPRPAP